MAFGPSLSELIADCKKNSVAPPSSSGRSATITFSKTPPDLETWYTCPRCGSLVRAGANCDCGFSPDSLNDLEVQEIVETYIRPIYPSRVSKDESPRSRSTPPVVVILLVISVVLSVVGWSKLFSCRSLYSDLEAKYEDLRASYSDLQGKYDAAKQNYVDLIFSKISALGRMSISDMSPEEIMSSSDQILKNYGVSSDPVLELPKLELPELELPELELPEMKISLP